MIDDDRLEAVLESVGAHLDTASIAPVARQRTIRPLLVAAAIVAVIATSVLAVAPARRSVGGWFGVGRTEFRVDVDLAVPADRVPGFVAGGRPIAPSRASGLAGVAVGGLDDSPLGPPAAWLAVPEGGALAVWDVDETSLWLLPVGDAQAVLFAKTVSAAGQVDQLADLGDGGVMVEGAHVLATPRRTVTAGTAVLWTSGGVAFRLERSAGAGSGAEFVEVAAAIDRLLSAPSDG